MHTILGLQAGAPTFCSIRRPDLVAKLDKFEGTVKNCAGGPTPWKSWLSCEESVVENGAVDKDKVLKMDAAHGYIFDVPSTGIATPVPLKAMGRFVHEAIAIDPKTGVVMKPKIALRPAFIDSFLYTREVDRRWKTSDAFGARYPRSDPQG